ncbi:MAG: ABC transporter permease [Micrococcales bacterium]|nr:ABC transporter permease [Micrococcales bacterium]
MTTTDTARTPGVQGVALRAGLYRGAIETRMALTNPLEAIGFVGVPVIMAVVLLFMRGHTVPGTDFSLGAMVLPGLIGMAVAFGGLTAPAERLATEREDGTLLRAKATPHGMTAYMVGKIVYVLLTTAVSMVVLLLPALLVWDDLRLGEPRSWLLLVMVFVLGMVATTPMGLALGALFKSTMQAGLLTLMSMGVIVVSGIFYPITALPGWLQVVGQALPFYWLGLGARSALLPPEMVAVEIGESWRTVEMFAVLGAWAVLGLVLAPILLRRMARRESGSAVAERRQKFLSRGY